jgi:hypothetical protein
MSFAAGADPVHKSKPDAGKNKGKMNAYFPRQMLV